MKTRDALQNEFYQIKQQMRGISPKLLLYKELQAKLVSLGAEISHFHEVVIHTETVAIEKTKV